LELTTILFTLFLPIIAIVYQKIVYKKSDKWYNDIVNLVLPCIDMSNLFSIVLLFVALWG
jgi:hypothetical protein